MEIIKNKKIKLLKSINCSNCNILLLKGSKVKYMFIKENERLKTLYFCNNCKK